MRAVTLRSLVESVARFGTPQYAYNLDSVSLSSDQLRQELPTGSTLYYSVKANPHPAILTAAGRSGLELEVSSIGETLLAREAGLSGTALFTGPGKSESDYSAALELGVRTFVVESDHDRCQLTRAAMATDIPVRYLIRVNAGALTSGGLHMGGRPTQFGVDIDSFSSRSHIFSSDEHVSFSGLHFFPVTNVQAPAELVRSFIDRIDTAKQIADRFGLDMRILALGGGFGAPFAVEGDVIRNPTLRSALSVRLKEAFPAGEAGPVSVSFESGRRLVAAAGFLLTSVRDLKRSGGRTFVIVDSGVNHLGGMAALGRVMRTKVKPTRLPRPGEVSSGCEEDLRLGHGDATITGILCTPVDVLAANVDASDLQRGDVLVFHNVGAYGLSASLLGFLSHPAPIEVLLSESSIVSASRIGLERTTVATGG